MEGIRPKMPSYHGLHTCRSYGLSCLNAGAHPGHCCLVLHRLELHRVAVNYQEVRTAAEARVNGRVERWLCGTDCYFHFHYLLADASSRLPSY